ncbi:MAG: DUF4434 domain-containing protein [Bacteroidales bacterium]|jgi:hypothetical protein|nr:DUF4434 domain-containing protein [Bacteroidales bacterium]
MKNHGAVTRRNFLTTLGAMTTGLTLLDEIRLVASKMRNFKPVEGSWFEFQHHNPQEGKYWNKILEGFSSSQWDEKIKEIADSGIRYLVLLDVAIYGKSFYPSELLPSHKMGCDDPLETILAAADKYGVNFFVSNGFFGEWTDPVFLMKDREVHRLRVSAMNEITRKYAHHKSFYGWYYPNETGINGHYDDLFIDYVNKCTGEALRLTPDAKTLIAPYGTRNVKPDDKFVRQLEKLNVDFIAYQDEIGVEKTRVEESAGFFRNLYELHKKAAKAKIWADVEVFRFEGTVYKSALLPASAQRVISQIEAVSPFVDKVLIYQYPGLINKPGTGVFAGHPDSASLYRQLIRHSLLRRSQA